MATKTDIELKIVDSVGTSHTEAEVLTDSAVNPDAFYVSRGYLAHNGEKVIEGIDPNGSYPNMTVGNAQKAKEAESATHAGTATDLSGRVEATPEVFTYRPSAGEKSIKDDNAFIRRVKGNSVVWNQLIDYTKIWVRNTGVTGLVENSTFTQDGADFDFLVTTDSSTPYRIWLQNPTTQNWIKGHKYLILSNLRGNINETQKPLRYYGGEFNIAPPYNNEEYGSIIVEPTENSTHPFALIQGSEITIPAGTYLKGHISVFDLTQMFGAGNEPTTVEEFRALYPDSYYPYNVGKLRNLSCFGIRTIGFNEFNGTYARVLPNETYYLGGEYTSIGFAKELGGATETITIPSNRLYAPTEIGYIYATGTDICINLHHTGYRDGEYEPYKEVTHSLPLSQITNGEPLRKAGNVYDEINETHYIKRVGVVDLGELEWVYLEHLFGGGTVAGFKTSIEDVIFANAATTLPNITVSKYNINTADKVANGYATTDIFTGYKAYKTALYAYFTFTTDASEFKASLAGIMLNYELAEPIVTPIETPLNLDYQVEDFGTEEALLADDSAPFRADIIYQFNATDQIRNNTRNINKLQKSAFTPSGTSAQYIRGDGSYGDRVELSQSTPINNGEFETTDEGDRQFILTPNYYAKSQVTLDNTTTIAVFVTAPENSHYLAEYWFEFTVDDTLPNIEYYQPNNSEAVFRIDGDMMTYAVNILHLISSDGGETFFGEIKNYVL